MIARILSVEEVPFGSALAADEASGSTSLLVEDASDFDGDGGELRVGSGDGEVVAYTSVDYDTNTVQLASATVSSWLTDDPVLLEPYSVERVALLASADGIAEEEGMEARVPLALYDKIPVGSREEGKGESVEAQFSADELVIVELTGQEPVTDPSYNVGVFSGVQLPFSETVTPPDVSRVTWVDEAGGKRAELVGAVDAFDLDSVFIRSGDPAPDGDGALLLREDGLSMFKKWGPYDAFDYYEPGDGLLDWTIDPLVVGSDTFNMTSQRLAGVAFVARRRITISTIVTRITTAGTSFNNWNGAAVYLWDDIGGGTMGWLFLGDTGTNNAALFNTVGERSLNLTAPIGPLDSGSIFYVALLASWTGTTPVIHGVTTAHMANVQRSNIYFSAGISGRTTRPNVDFSHASLSTFTNVPWIGVK